MSEADAPMSSPLAWELLVRATTFTFAGRLTIEKRGDNDSWAIRDGLKVWGRGGRWEDERDPSARDKEFLTRCRWSLQEACHEVCRWLGADSSFRKAMGDQDGRSGE